MLPEDADVDASGDGDVDAGWAPAGSADNERECHDAQIEDERVRKGLQDFLQGRS